MILLNISGNSCDLRSNVILEGIISLGFVGIHLVFQVSSQKIKWISSQKMKWIGLEIVQAEEGPYDRR